MKKLMILFFLALSFHTAVEAHNWLVAFNVRIHHDKISTIGAICHKKTGEYVVPVLGTMGENLLASETSKLIEVQYSDLQY